jgi:hypothetical protein
MEEHAPLVPERVVEATVGSGSAKSVEAKLFVEVVDLQAQIREMADLMDSMKKEIVEMKARQKEMAKWSARYYDIN